jgi:CobQ-like glutamine amidotransferase family enzyme
MKRLRIATMFPSATVAAGDEANAAALVRRAAARGIACEHLTVERARDEGAVDLYLLGGTGRASAQSLAERLAGTRLVERVRGGEAAVLAVDAGVDALCRGFLSPTGGEHAGLGLLDAVIRPGRPAVGTVATRPNRLLGLPAMIGWIGTEGTIARDPGVAALAQRIGRLPRGAEPAEGIDGGPVIATRLHGPVLALNPELADLLLARAIGEDVRSWPALPWPAAERARAERIAEVVAPAGPRRRPRRLWPVGHSMRR